MILRKIVFALDRKLAKAYTEETLCNFPAKENHGSCSIT